MKNKILTILPIFLILILSTFTIIPLFHSGFFPMHDNTQIQRVYEMFKSLRDGMFPVRWVNDLGYGYGYPIFNFYAPLAYYVGAFFVFVFSNSLLATKVMIGISFVGSSITMYLLGKSIFGKIGGIIPSLLYSFAPYHAVDLYVRGDIGELWAYIFLPLVALGFYRIYTLTNNKNESKKSLKLNLLISNSIWIVIASVGFCGVILSHNLSAFMLAPFLLIGILIASFFSKNKYQTVLYFMIAFVLGIGLSTFYTLPVFFEMKYTNVLSQIGGGANFRDHFVCINQLWQSNWGFGGSAKGCVDGFSFMIGKINLLLSLLALIILPFIRRDKKLFVIDLGAFMGLAVSIFLMLPISKDIWETIKPMSFIQYPWRYLIFVSFFSSILGGVIIAVLSKINKKIGLIFCSLTILAILILSIKYFQPQTYLKISNTQAISKSMLSWTISKISDEYMPVGFEKPKIESNLPTSLIKRNDFIKIQSENIKTQDKNIQFNLEKAGFVGLNLAYFPAWHVFDNGSELPLKITKNGTEVYLSRGFHNLNVVYESTTPENVGNIISLTSLFILILGIIWKVTKKYDKKGA